LVLGTGKTNTSHYAVGKLAVVGKLQHMDGVSVMDDDITDNEHTVNHSLCLSLILSLYFVYNVEYPNETVQHNEIR